MHASDQTQAIDARLLNEVFQFAARQGISPEVWLRRQLQAQSRSANVPVFDDDEAVIFDMVKRHFDELRLDVHERRAVADAMFDTIDNGDANDVGQLGPMRRSYRFRRRAGVLSIRTGQGRVDLSIPYALRLATAIDAVTRHRQPDEKAA